MTKLRFIMRKKGFTGKTLAEACGVGRSIVYKYMCGSRKLSYKVAARFAEVLKVAPGDLIGDY